MGGLQGACCGKVWHKYGNSSASAQVKLISKGRCYCTRDLSEIYGNCLSTVEEWEWQWETKCSQISVFVL